MRRRPSGSEKYVSGDYDAELWKQVCDAIKQFDYERVEEIL